MYYHFKRCHAIFPALTLLVLALSIVVGTIWEESYAVVGLTAAATFIKGWSEFKKYSVKTDMCRFAYTTYEKTLIELKNFARGGLEDMTHLLVKMQTLDEIVRDFSPPTYDTSRSCLTIKDVVILRIVSYDIMGLFERNQTFLKSLLREANAKRRNVMLDLANKDQINAISEMVLNLIKRKIPIRSGTYHKLKRYKNVLRALGKRRNSLKRRREQLRSQTGSGLWQGLYECYKCVR